MLVSDIPFDSPEWDILSVLILVLVDVGLGHGSLRPFQRKQEEVLILVLVDVGLGLVRTRFKQGL